MIELEGRTHIECGEHGAERTRYLVQQGLRVIRFTDDEVLADYVEESANKLGGEVVSRQTFSEQDKSFKAQLTAMTARGPQAIFVSAYYTEAALIARQARQLGIKATLMGPEGFDSPMLIESGGDAVEGAYFSNHYSADSPNPRTQEFVKAYAARYGERPGDAVGAGAGA